MATYWNLWAFGRPATDAEWAARLDRAAEAIQQLGGDEPPHIVGLSEVYHEAVPRELAQRLGGGYATMFFGSDTGRWPGDLALLYREDLFVEMPPRQQYPEANGRSRCRSAVVPLQLAAGQPTLLLSVNHWPWGVFGDSSRADYDRLGCASWLWDRLQQRLDVAVAIVMGDFNVAPFSGVWRAPYDLATRFRSDAAREPESLTPLYNTAWRFLQDPLGPDGRDIRPKVAWPATRGSFRFHDGEWHVVDQLLVSGQALDGGILRLVEETVCYATPDGVATDDEGVLTPQTWVWDAANGTGQGMSDHYPVVAAFELSLPGGDDGT